MHFRAPSVLNGISNMRRRSAGAMIYNQATSDDTSFASSHSQPNVQVKSLTAAVSHHAGEGMYIIPTQIRNISLIHSL